MRHAQVQKEAEGEEQGCNLLLKKKKNKGTQLRKGKAKGPKPRSTLNPLGWLRVPPLGSYLNPVCQYPETHYETSRTGERVWVLSSS